MAILKKRFSSKSFTGFLESSRVLRQVRALLSVVFVDRAVYFSIKYDLGFYCKIGKS